MADNFYTYIKKRKEFGRDARGLFTDIEPKILANIVQNANYKSNYIPRDPFSAIFSNIPEYSEHAVNTDRVATSTKAMKHIEGGWPKEVDPTEPQDTKKWKKKLDKDPGFAAGVKDTVNSAKTCVKQNNQIDLFEDYFKDEIPSNSNEAMRTKTLMLFRDICCPEGSSEKRQVSKIAFHPEAMNKIAVGYAQMKFQPSKANIPVDTLMWDINSPNEPDLRLSPPSPLYCLSFNPKTSDIIAGGCTNGVVAIWDLRKSTKGQPAIPIDITEIEKSHSEPAFDICWLVGKTGSELVSASTDGRVIWWDIRKINEGPTDMVLLTDGTPSERRVGATRVEYNSEQPTKYLVATEQGYILQLNKRPKKSVEVSSRYGVEAGKHHGPIYACQRNPFANKYFLTVGDWSSKIWSEDIKTPLISTKYLNTFLTDGCWSPTRAGLFFITRSDGWIDMWDYFYRQNEVAYSQKISEAALTCIAVRSNGSLIALGDAAGNVSIIQLCESLYVPENKQEKNIIGMMFERESKKEKYLETQKKLTETKKEKPKEQNYLIKKQKLIEERTKQSEDEFYKKIQSLADKAKIEDEEDQEEGDRIEKRDAKMEEKFEAKKIEKKEEESPKVDRSERADLGKSPSSEIKMPDPTLKLEQKAPSFPSPEVEIKKDIEKSPEPSPQIDEKKIELSPNSEMKLESQSPEIKKIEESPVSSPEKKEDKIEAKKEEEKKEVMKE